MPPYPQDCKLCAALKPNRQVPWCFLIFLGETLTVSVNQGYFATTGAILPPPREIDKILWFPIIYTISLQFLYNISSPEKNILPKCYFLRFFSKFDKFELWNGIYLFY